ncbi:MAG: helix-turn-helix domain-containing protein [Stenotrophomonas sp.]|uniref:helix-turn-helix domain-containing protein n=1 Tax=Gammaproteobacteria TaxID=1236 RepID=UPI003D6D7991
MKELREALGWSQAQAAALVGVRREMWAKYEAGSEPGAKVLGALTAAGWDVLYILSGHRSGISVDDSSTGLLSPREAALVDNYRNSPEDAKAALDKTSAAFAQPRSLIKQARLQSNK